MSAETLRRAAALMRERAEAATAGEWAVRHRHYVIAGRTPGALVGCDEPADAEHIASWHPAVALAAADLLDDAADLMDEDKGIGCIGVSHKRHVLGVARAYLGSDK